MMHTVLSNGARWRMPSGISARSMAHTHTSPSKSVSLLTIPHLCSAHSRPGRPHNSTHGFPPPSRTLPGTGPRSSSILLSAGPSVVIRIEIKTEPLQAPPVVLKVQVDGLRLVRAFRRIVQPEPLFPQQVAVVGFQHRAVLHFKAAFSIGLEVAQGIDRTGKIPLGENLQTDFHCTSGGNFVRHRHGLYRKGVFLLNSQVTVTGGKAEGSSHAAARHYKIKYLSHKCMNREWLENIVEQNSVLGMEMSGRAAPEDPFTQPQSEGEAVCQADFRLQCHGAAVDERPVFLQPGTVVEQPFSPVHALIPHQAGKADVQEHDFPRTREEVAVIPRFPRILHDRDSRVPVRVVAPHDLPAVHPFVTAFGVGEHGQGEGIPRIRPVFRRIEPVRHLRRQLHAPHAPEVALGLRPPRDKGEQGYGKVNHPVSHRTFSSLTVSARTRSPFSSSKAWCRPPCFSNISTTSFLSSGMVNFGRANTVHADFLPSTRVT